MPRAGYKVITLRAEDYYDLRRLADTWGLSLSDTMHALVAVNVKALGWQLTRATPVKAHGKSTCHRVRLLHPERPEQDT